MALDITYEGKDYVLDLEDMDLEDSRAMERFGVKNLKDLETGISEGNIDALTVAFWLMLKQSGEPGVRVDRVRFKPVKFVKSLIAATTRKIQDENEGNDEGA